MNAIVSFASVVWVILTKDLWTGKAWASFRNRPFMLVKMTQSPRDEFELETDYNQALVQQLIDLGYEGSDPQDLVDQYVVYCTFFALNDHAKRFLANLSLQDGLPPAGDE